MIKFIIVDDEPKWIKEFERVVNDELFKSDKKQEA